MSDFSLLNRKNIIEILDGDVEVGTSEMYRVAMPYLKGTQLVQMCLDFGLKTEYGASRWIYLQDLMTYMDKNERFDELLQYIFSLERFTDLQSLESPEKIKEAHKNIVGAVLNKINAILVLGKHELQLVNGNFVLSANDKKTVISQTNIKSINIPYVDGLSERCKGDFLAGNYDSVITKSRTLIEEVLIYILEKNQQEVESKGDLLKLSGQIKKLFHMQQSKDYDGRLNNLLSGLEKIVQSIAEMRNMNSDAHGVGSKRIAIRECEAKLIMNSAITYCEYILAIQKTHENTSGI